MENIKKNNITNLREVNKLSVAELAQKLDISRQNLYKIEKGERGISLVLQDKLCKIFNCSIPDLYNMTEIKMSVIKEISIELKFYPNLLQQDVFDITKIKDYETMQLPDKFMKVLEIAKSNLIATKIHEKNMEPIISKNDFMIIDLNKKDIANNKIYLIYELEKLKIKRIQRLSPFDTTVTIKSENEIDGEYPPYTVSIEKAKEMILGQVVFYGRSIL